MNCPVKRAMPYGWLVGWFVWVATPVSWAQIVPDTTLPVNSLVPLGCAVCPITGGTVRGVNLFHSFQEFSIPSGGAAWFHNDGQIQSIFTRVTGTNPSNLDGLLRANGTAHLFLLNPNGILFGANARLQIGGSFLATTGDRFQFFDGSEFSAINPQAPPLLTVNLTSGLQVGHGQTAITHNGHLEVRTGQTLTLSGSNITSTGSLIAPGGAVEVFGAQVTLLEQAQIDVSSSAGGGTALIGGDFQGRGDAPTATHTYIAPNVTIHADALQAGDGGRVIIWAEETTGFYGTVTARGGLNSGNGGFVEVSGRQALLFRGSVDTSAVNGGVGTLLLDPVNLIIANGNGAINDNQLNAGVPVGEPQGQIQAIPGGDFTISEQALEALPTTTNILLEATNDIIINDLADNVLRFAAGPGGSITFKADADGDGNGSFSMNSADAIDAPSRDITISGVNIVTGSIFTPGPANAGNITLTATGNIETSRLGAVTFLGSTANGGNITLNARGNITTADVQSIISLDNPAGNAGNLLLTAGGNITSDYIDAATFGFNGRGGSVTLRAGGNIRVGGYVGAPSFPGRSGNAGQVTIIAENNIEIGAGIDTSGDFSGGEIALNSRGSISIGTVLNSTSKEGNGGFISLNAVGDIIIPNVYSTSSALNGNSGDIFIISSNGGITSTSRVDTSGFSFGVVNAGKIELRAQNDISVHEVFAYASTDGRGNGNEISLVSNTGKINISGNFNSTGGIGNGRGGAIILQADNDIIINNDHIWSFSNGAGVGGSITIASGGTLTLTNQEINSFRNSRESRFIPSTGGEIRIQAGSVNLTDSNVVGGTASFNKAGDINITATEAIRLFNGSRIRNQTFGLGDAGNITMNSRQLFIQNDQPGSTVITGIGTETYGSGSGGDLIINATEQIALIGNQPGAFTPDPNDPVSVLGAIATRTGITTATAGSGSAGNLTLNTRELVIRDGAGATTASLSLEPDAGNGGRLQVNAEGSIHFQGRAGLATSTLGFGNAGDLTINAAGPLTLRDGAVISTDTVVGSSGNAGNLQITTSQLQILNGARIGTATAGAGQGGDLVLNTGQFIISQAGQLTASGSNQGAAGNLFVTADSIQMSDRGLMRVSTQIGTGGNITLQVASSIILRNGSEISAEAFGIANGGNIHMDVGQFVLGVLTEDSDVIAKAFAGNGGRISVRAAGVFGFRLYEGQDTPESDFVASSDLGIDGVVTVETEDKLEESPPLQFVDPSTLLSLGCIPRASSLRSLGTTHPPKFVITGRGGLPPHPDEPLNHATILTADGQPFVMHGTSETNAPNSSSDTIIEAQGWAIDTDGSVVLIAQTRPIAAPPPWRHQLNCQENQSIRNFPQLEHNQKQISTQIANPTN